MFSFAHKHTNMHCVQSVTFSAKVNETCTQIGIGKKNTIQVWTFFLSSVSVVLRRYREATFFLLCFVTNLSYSSIARISRIFFLFWFLMQYLHVIHLKYRITVFANTARPHLIDGINAAFFEDKHSNVFLLRLSLFTGCFGALAVTISSVYKSNG